MASKVPTVAAVMAWLMDTDDENNHEAFAAAVLAEAAILFSRTPRTRIPGYAESVVINYNHVEFKKLFRMSRPTFQSVLNYLVQCPELSVGGSGGRDPISPDKQLLVTLWYLSGTDSINKIADRFGISESSVIACRKRIIGSVLNNLKCKFISWPENVTIQQIVENFERRNGFPGIVGALDGTHIEIKAPSENPQCYINRKKFHSLILQAVCDADMLFLHCFAGFPGSCHDARVLRNSSLWNNGMQICHNNHIIADCAYPLCSWLLTPYRDNGHLNAHQRNFNNTLSVNRVVIERAFSLLKGRFRRLRFIDTQDIQTAVDIIMTACVFHNICLMYKEDIDYIDINNDPGCCVGENNVCYFENERAGVLKREQLARALLN